ncbi:hypothetical protein C0J52_18567 [Blattella germanica]|nr:hypothetical protein C0J52_18567 [Blattella germanica]
MKISSASNWTADNPTLYQLSIAQCSSHLLSPAASEECVCFYHRNYDEKGLAPVVTDPDFQVSVRRFCNKMSVLTCLVNAKRSGTRQSPSKRLQPKYCDYWISKSIEYPSTRERKKNFLEGSLTVNTVTFVLNFLALLINYTPNTMWGAYKSVRNRISVRLIRTSMYRYMSVIGENGSSFWHGNNL